MCNIRCPHYQQKNQIKTCHFSLGFPASTVVENLPVNADAVSIPGLGKFSGGENGNPLQYSCLENSTDRGAWWATIHGVAKSQMQLSTHTHLFIYLFIYFESIKLLSAEIKVISNIRESLKKHSLSHWCSCKMELSSWYFIANIKILRSGLPVNLAISLSGFIPND